MNSSIFDFVHNSFLSKIKNRKPSSVNLDEMAHYKPFYLDVHCLQKNLVFSAGLKMIFISR